MNYITFDKSLPILPEQICGASFVVMYRINFEIYTPYSKYKTWDKSNSVDHIEDKDDGIVVTTTDTYSSAPVKHIFHND